MSQPRVIVGVDGSRAAENALLWAAGEAQRRSARLVIAYAGDAELMPLPLKYAAAHSGGPLLAASRRLVSDAGFHCEVDTICRNQPAVVLLSELGRGAELLVVGAHGMARTCCSSLGSVAYGVVAHAPCSVAVIGPWPPSETGSVNAGQRRPVTVGVTANPTCTATLEFAFAEAALRESVVKAVHSWAEADWSEAAALAMLPRTGQAVRAHHENRLASILVPLRQKYPDIAVELCVSGDPVARSLADASEGSSMLVLGCRHPGGPLGPTAARLVHVSRCPVVIVGNPPVTTGGLPTRELSVVGEHAVTTPGGATAVSRVEWCWASIVPQTPTPA
ncbi:MAG TPA: universal stress protein [Jatrophihabitans sp.]|jgi:nucleotide-binding universal stress UspA family protein|uniref:universal stress protein n=1 Tax=Jatrophihabitans sp. TaxID=1932789 RepID=UPI002F039013